MTETSALWRVEPMLGSLTKPPRHMGWAVVRGHIGDPHYAIDLSATSTEAAAIALRDALNAELKTGGAESHILGTRT